MLLACWTTGFINVFMFGTMNHVCTAKCCRSWKSIMLNKDNFQFINHYFITLDVIQDSLHVYVIISLSSGHTNSNCENVYEQLLVNGYNIIY